VVVVVTKWKHRVVSQRYRRERGREKERKSGERKKEVWWDTLLTTHKRKRELIEISNNNNNNNNEQLEKLRGGLELLSKDTRRSSGRNIDCSLGRYV
jgi:hypothetical protein